MAGKTSFDSTGRWAQECGRQHFADRFQQVLCKDGCVARPCLADHQDRVELIHNLSAFSLSGPQALSSAALPDVRREL